MGAFYVDPQTSTDQLQRGAFAIETISKTFGGRLCGQGIGVALLVFAETWLHSVGACVCIVNSHIRRLDAHRFYEREGYQRTGHRFEKKWR